MTINIHSISDDFSEWEADLLDTKSIIPKRIDSKDVKRELAAAIMRAQSAFGERRTALVIKNIETKLKKEGRHD